MSRASDTYNWPHSMHDVVPRSLSTLY